MIAGLKIMTVLHKVGEEGGALCFRVGGAEDNFISYIEYCFFFVPVMK